MRDGGLPVSHGLCPSCSATLNTELDTAEAAHALRQAVLTVERRIEESARLRRLAMAVVLALCVAVPLQAQDRIGPAPYTVLIVGQIADLTTTLESLHSGRGKEGNVLWASSGTAGFIAIKTSSALAMGFAMHQLASHGHPRAAKVLGYSAGFALMGVGISNARVGRVDGHNRERSDV